MCVSVEKRRVTDRGSEGPDRWHCCKGCNCKKGKDRQLQRDGLAGATFVCTGDCDGTSGSTTTVMVHGFLSFRQYATIDPVGPDRQPGLQLNIIKPKNKQQNS